MRPHFLWRQLWWPLGGRGWLTECPCGSYPDCGWKWPAEGGGHCCMAVRHPQKLGSAFCKDMSPIPWGERLFPSVGWWHPSVRAFWWGHSREKELGIRECVLCSVRWRAVLLAPYHCIRRSSPPATVRQVQGQGRGPLKSLRPGLGPCQFPPDPLCPFIHHPFHKHFLDTSVPGLCLLQVGHCPVGEEADQSWAGREVGGRYCDKHSN